MNKIMRYEGNNLLHGLASVLLLLFYWQSTFCTEELILSIKACCFAADTGTEDEIPTVGTKTTAGGKTTNQGTMTGQRHDVDHTRAHSNPNLYRSGFICVVHQRANVVL